MNQVVINLAEEMITSGTYDPLILITDWESTDPVWETVRGLKTVRWRIRFYQPGMGLKQQLAYACWEWRFRWRFAEFCREHRVSVINPHYPGPTSLAIERVFRLTGIDIPLVLSFHGADLTAIQQSTARVNSYWRHVARRGHRIVACSQDMANRIAETFNSDLPIKVVHNGVDVAKLINISGTPILLEGRIILNVAKFEDKKGQDCLIRAFSSIARNFSDVSLVLVGATDRKLNSLRELCADLKIDKRVHFYPDMPHHQVVEFFRRATLFVLPSRQEPFGIVLLEAGAFGLPVVASRVGGIPEILDDGITGRLVPSEDIAALAEGISFFLTSPDAAKEFGGRLKRHVESNFAWSRVLSKYLAIVKSTAA